MSQYCSIKVKFDAPIGEETRNALYEDLREIDYDFPRSCLYNTDEWTSYRHPTYGDAKIVDVFLKHNATGCLWVVDGEVDYGYEPRDSNCLVFRHGVDPHSVANTARVKSQAEYLQRVAKQWIALADAFNAPHFPVKYNALDMTTAAYVQDREREEFETVVKSILGLDARY